MKLFTIGPTEMYETTKKVREQGVPYFRNQSFSHLMLETDEMLKRCMKTANTSEAVYLTASGTAGLEAVVDNLIRKEDRVLIVEGGGFGKRFVEICEQKGIQRDVVHLELDEILTEAHFAPFKEQKYKAVLVNLHETSTGQLYDIQLLKAGYKSFAPSDGIEIAKQTADFITCSCEDGVIADIVEYIDEDK